MKYMTSILPFVATAQASFAGNLNYHSASLRHPSLGVAINKVAARSYAASPFEASELNFTHGVASGDPYADSVILWTRVAPIKNSDNDKSNVTVEGNVDMYSHETEEYVKASTAPVCVEWRIGVAEDVDCASVDSGTIYTSSDIDWTVKVEAKGLKPHTTYYYQFNVCNSNNTSPLGRTKTIPKKDSKVSKAVKLAVYSCSNFAYGFFNAFGNVNRKDSVDYVVFLGDYIYEYADDYKTGEALDRVPLPNREAFTLYDYRKRIATYRTDPDLYLNHQRFPWIAVWDDHEFSDNEWKGGSVSINNTEESFVQDGGVSVEQRKMNVVRAYFEWMPIRQVAMDDGLRIWRNFHFGDLFDLSMLDTRGYDRSITDTYENTDYIEKIADEPNRSLMGPRQEAWFYRSLEDSARRGTTWRLVGNQAVFSRINQTNTYKPGEGDGKAFNYDQWDGYTANRNRTLRTLYEKDIGNNIFLAGDSHASWVSDLVWLGEKKYDQETGMGSVGVEFAGSAVTSPSPVGDVIPGLITVERANEYADWIIKANEELHWQDMYYRGYYELSVGYDAVNASWFGLPLILTANGYEIPLANFTVLSGDNHLYRDDGVAALTGKVEAGSLKFGERTGSNLTHDTATGEWFRFDESMIPDIEMPDLDDIDIP